MVRVLLSVSLGFSLLLLAACGFHLRGEATLPTTLTTMYLQGVNTQQDLGLELKRSLSRNGVTVLDGYQDGAAVLTVLSHKIDKRVLSVGSAAKVSEYGLHGVVKFKVSDGQGKVLSPPQAVEAQRSFIFDQNQVLAMGDEETALRAQITEQLVQSILRRLAALK